MSYLENRQNPTTFRAMTGLAIEDFDNFLPWFEEAHDEYFRYHTLEGKPRRGIRAHVIYRNSPLPSVAERLYFILVYYKNNPLQTYHGNMFGMTQQKCGQWVHTLTGIMEKALKDCGKLPPDNNRDFQNVLKNLKGDVALLLYHDATEREIPRPVSPELQQARYSGKKKRHTLKNAVITTILGAILFVSPSVDGRVHDKRIAETYYEVPAGIILVQDTGYLGYRHDGPTITPVKKKPGKELEDYEKQFNRQIASMRVKVEHYIGSAKIMRIVKDECRLRKNQFVNSIFRIAAGLHNLRRCVNLSLKY